MNTTLVNYGIYQEQADIHAHVSVVGHCVYVFFPQSAIAAIETGRYSKVPVYTGEIITAYGYLIPPREIDGCKYVPVSNELIQKTNFEQTDNTSIKGQKAVYVTQSLLRSGHFPLLVKGRVINDRDMQIRGTDIVVEMKLHIQVKCDWKAGENPGCTGNLFIQVAECNPHKMH